MTSADWPPPWREISDAAEAVALVRELQREAPAGHPLAGRAIYAMARRDDQDEVLFTLDDGAVAQVHLTWNGKPDPSIPWVQIFRNADVWREQLSGD